MDECIHAGENFKIQNENKIVEGSYSKKTVECGDEEKDYLLNT